MEDAVLRATMARTGCWSTCLAQLASRGDAGPRGLARGDNSELLGLLFGQFSHADVEVCLRGERVRSGAQ